MPSKTQSILIGGAVVGLLSTSYLNFINLLCCAGVIIGALVGVWHYTSEHRLTIDAGQGALIGTLAGVTGAIIAGVLNYVLMLLGLDAAGQLQQMIMDLMPQEGMSAEQRAQMEQQMEMAENMSRSPALVAINIVTSMVIYAIFGAIGGAIGASIFKKGEDEAGAVTGEVA